MTPEQEELVLQWRGFAYAMAKKLDHLALVARVSYEEFCQEAILGLCRAVVKWDPAKSYAGDIKTFFALRIRGHLIDFARKNDVLTRGEKKRLSHEGLYWRDAQNERRDLSLDAPAHSDDMDHHVLCDFLAAPESSDPGDRADVLAMLASLPERERMVLFRYFFEDQTLDQIAEEEQITGSRVSQIKSRALERLERFSVG